MNSFIHLLHKPHRYQHPPSAPSPVADYYIAPHEEGNISSCFIIHFCKWHVLVAGRALAIEERCDGNFLLGNSHISNKVFGHDMESLHLYLQSSNESCHPAPNSRHKLVMENRFLCRCIPQETRSSPSSDALDLSISPMTVLIRADACSRQNCSIVYI